jgi:hypothetical protein
MSNAAFISVFEPPDEIFFASANVVGNVNCHMDCVVVKGMTNNLASPFDV